MSTIKKIRVNGQDYDIGGTADNLNLNDLNDVDIDSQSLIGGQLLVYNSSTENWENIPLAGSFSISASDGHLYLNDPSGTLGQFQIDTTSGHLYAIS